MDVPRLGLEGWLATRKTQLNKGRDGHVVKRVMTQLRNAHARTAALRRAIDTELACTMGCRSGQHATKCPAYHRARIYAAVDDMEKG